MNVFDRARTIKQNAILPFLHLVRLMWRANPRMAFLSIVIRLGQGLLPVGSAWITKLIFDQLAAALSNSDSASLFQAVLPLLVLQAVFAASANFMQHVAKYLTEELQRSVELLSQKIVYGRINDLNGLAHFENPRFYDTIQMGTQGIRQGAGQALSISVSMLSSVVSIIGFLGALFWIDPILVLMVFAGTIPYLVINLRLSRQEVDVALMNTPRTRKQSYYERLLSSVDFAKEIRLYRLGDYILRRLLNVTKDVHAEQRTHAKRELKWEFVLAIFSQVLSAVAFVVVVWQALQQNITVGDVTLYISAFDSIQSSLMAIAVSFSQLYGFLMYYKYYDKLMTTPQLVQEPDKPSPVPALEDGIKFKNIWFRYSDDHPWIFKGLDLFLPRGKCVALIGMNGAGKTTLAKLLTRLYDPDKGQILWDGTDIRDFEIDKLHRRVRTIFQDFARYDLSVRENIGFGSIDHVDDVTRIKHAARQANAHTFIDDLPDQYRTVLSRWLVEDGKGIDLSGGQWQRIAMARLLMEEHDLFILDEPTAALDPEAEYKLFEHFQSITSRMTTLLISHRFSTVRMADYIAVIEDGEIVEYGTHRELMTMKGQYAHLYNLQSERYTF